VLACKRCLERQTLFAFSPAAASSRTTSSLPPTTSATGSSTVGSRGARRVLRQIDQRGQGEGGGLRRAGPSRPSRNRSPCSPLIALATTSAGVTIRSSAIVVLLFIDSGKSDELGRHGGRIDLPGACYTTSTDVTPGRSLATGAHRRHPGQDSETLLAGSPRPDWPKPLEARPTLVCIHNCAPSRAQTGPTSSRPRSTSRSNWRLYWQTCGFEVSVLATFAHQRRTGRGPRIALAHLDGRVVWNAFSSPWASRPPRATLQEQ
jgi:hypothetical protein